jgi:hypothetical protein
LGITKKKPKNASLFARYVVISSMELSQFYTSISKVISGGERLSTGL